MLGVLGTGVELVLIAHYEDTLQLVPLASIALALAVLIWHSVKSDARSVRALQATMVLFIVAGAAGSGFISAAARSSSWKSIRHRAAGTFSRK